MKLIRTLLTAALCLSAIPAVHAQPPAALPFNGPTTVMTLGPDGVIRCEALPKPAPVSAYAEAAAANNDFAFAVYADLAGEAEASENLFFSPISVTAALALTYEGARGTTQAGFEQAMSMPEGLDRPGYHGSLSALLGELDGQDKPYALSVANSLWGEQSMPFRDAFLETLDTHYEAGFNSVDFKKAPEQQRKLINEWVEKQTQERIKDLLPAGSIDGLTRLVLANAIYFKGPWQHQFQPRLTQDRPFYMDSKEQAPADALSTPTMLLPKKTLRHADLDGLNILEMPYKSRDLSMLILLPDDRDGLADLESKLSAKALGRWVTELKHGPVRVLLPKWEATLSTNLVPTLKRLGLSEAFDAGKADFTGMTDSAEGEGLFITDVFHKAFIKVDEEGSEAAAATAVVIGVKSAAIPQEPFAFTADHPFIYVIRDNRSGAVLFIGRMADPS